MRFLYICMIPVFRFHVESSGEPEVVLQNLVYGSIIITACVGRTLFVYAVICIFTIFRCNSYNWCHYW